VIFKSQFPEQMLSLLLKGARYERYFPSGDILYDARSGFLKKSLNGISRRLVFVLLISHLDFLLSQIEF
jgi:hypothetical protein